MLCSWMNEGHLYGTTQNGGGTTACPEGCRVEFKISKTRKEKVLYRFAEGDDGAGAQGIGTVSKITF
jgi:hypothetical protein